MEPGYILVVDDTPNNLQLLVDLLSTRSYQVRAVTTGKAALEMVHSQPPILILLDINMPGMNGYEVCKQLKEDETTSHIPVIFLSVIDNTDDKLKAFRLGGVDYITKPFHIEEVLARVQSQINQYWQRLEIEALRAKDQLYVEKLTQFIENLMKTASHDLRNPLTGINTAVYLLERYGRLDDDKGQGYLHDIRNRSDQMLALITDLLDVAKIEIDPPPPS